MMTKIDELTSRKYWEAYYHNASVSRDQISFICSEYDQFWELLINRNECNKPSSILEIGGYPGRYLAYLSSKYNLIPTSLDFNSDREKIHETMEAFGINKYNVIQTDFLAHQPTEQFDIVISNGFIEHFTNFNEVMDKHVAYLKEGGTLLIMIPNKRWFRKWYGVLVDHKNLQAHNLKSMRKKVFTDFAIRNKLELLEFTYFGGFAYNPHQKLNKIQEVIYQSFRLLFKKVNPIIERHPNRFFSSSIVACFKK